MAEQEGQCAGPRGSRGWVDRGGGGLQVGAALHTRSGSGCVGDKADIHGAAADTERVFLDLFAVHLERLHLSGRETFMTTDSKDDYWHWS